MTNFSPPNKQLRYQTLDRYFPLNVDCRTKVVSPLKETKDLNGNSNKGVKRIASPIDSPVAVSKKKGRRIIESDEESSGDEKTMKTEEDKSPSPIKV